MDGSRYHRCQFSFMWAAYIMLVHVKPRPAPRMTRAEQDKEGERCSPLWVRLADEFIYLRFNVYLSRV